MKYICALFFLSSISKSFAEPVMVQAENSKYPSGVAEKIDPEFGKNLIERLIEQDFKTKGKNKVSKEDFEKVVLVQQGGKGKNCKKNTYEVWTNVAFSKEEGMSGIVMCIKQTKNGSLELNSLGRGILGWPSGS